MPWAIALLLAIGGCQTQGEGLGEGEGSTTETAAACAQIGAAALSATTLSVMSSTGEEGALYCGRGDTYLLASRRLSNDCFSDGFPCRRFEPLGSSPAIR